MKLNFNNKQMEIGTGTFNFVRTLMVAPTGGAEINECFLTAEKIKDNDREGWIHEWTLLAEKTSHAAENAMRSGQAITARQAYLRASNYYRAAMFYIPYSEDRLNSYITLSRECFHKAAKLFAPLIEAIEIPLGAARLPGYFLSAGQSKGLTLIAINGGDSTNEELVHWIGYAAAARGWNFLTFEGPGQWGALQMNPGLHMRHDYEVPVKAAVDFLLQRDVVDPERIALIGYSWGASLAARAAALDKRICACVSDGLIVDVFEAWAASMPAILRKDAIFTKLEKASLQLFGLFNMFRRMLGLSEPHEIFNALRAYNISAMASQMRCPLLLLYGEAEYAQSNEKVALSNLRFIRDLTGPASIHEFEYTEGWAATHCQIGGLSAVQDVVFDWLERTVNKTDYKFTPSSLQNLAINRYLKSGEIKKMIQGTRLNVV